MRLIDADKLRKDVLDLPNCPNGFSDTYDKAMILTLVDEQPTVEAEPTEEQFEWCHDCKEYDQNTHCCHRWTKVIRNTVNDLKTQGYEPVRHGHWEFIGGYGYQYRCSACNTCAERKTKFCPYCGAKMDGERRDEDETD